MCLAEVGYSPDLAFYDVEGEPAILVGPRGVPEPVAQRAISLANNQDPRLTFEYRPLSEVSTT